VSAEELAARFRRHASLLTVRGSALYTELLARVADDVEAQGPCWTVLAGHERDRRGTVPTLRFMGGVHRLVLEGRAPELGRFYPSAGGDASDLAGAWKAFRATVEEHPASLRELMQRPIQTNEVGRAAALLGGFLLVARETGLPLRLLEVGASAGLLLRWDRYRYETGDGAAWGDAESPLRLRLEGTPPPLDGAVAVASRRGCDAHPLDPASEEDRLTLRCFVWPDQVWRHEALEAALGIAAGMPVAIDRERAEVWIEQQLGREAVGAATVVFHSIVLQYLAPEERARFSAALVEAGARATREAPLAWLRMEEAGAYTDVRLTLWPGGSERLLARAGYHGSPVEWLVS
jgi:hypothetical protein